MILHLRRNRTFIISSILALQNISIFQYINSPHATKTDNLKYSWLGINWFFLMVQPQSHSLPHSTSGKSALTQH